ISHFDYYQPESYIPRRDLFIEKDSSINDDLERLRLSATTSLLGYDDVIVIASVSANYGLGNPEEYLKVMEKIKVGEKRAYKSFLLKLVEMGYSRNEVVFDRGSFRATGECVDIFPAYNDAEFIRIEFFGDEIERMAVFDALERNEIKRLDSVMLYAASQFAVGSERLNLAIKSIEDELALRLKFFK
ncbi:excinuclease ABC subunit B, partial [Helicobacter pylori]|nr:excinuclease ABC subunit B [Helicobacter pylori]